MQKIRISKFWFLLLLEMLKEYYKLKDIKADILTYKKSLRGYAQGSAEYKQIEVELNRLKDLKERLKKQNSGNPAFFHNGIPPMPKKFSVKQKLLNELYQELKEEGIRHARATESIQFRIKEVKKS